MTPDLTDPDEMLPDARSWTTGELILAGITAVAAATALAIFGWSIL